jgi:two-component system, chemotaxis family, protein-glutamate methylesterase/glutaminase
MMGDPIRVLIADDSPFICKLLASYMQSAPGIEVIGAVHDGREAVAKVKQSHPDAVTLDLEMPVMDGLEALGHIMRECPTPVIVISGASGRGATRTMQALDLGAVDFVLKYTAGVDIDPEQLRLEICAKVKAAAQMRVGQTPENGLGLGGLVRKRAPSRASAYAAGPGSAAPWDVVVIGASTGGPTALRQLLGELPSDYGSALIVVQHIPKSFTAVLAAQLNRTSRLEVREAEDGDELRSGLVLVAPGGYHLIVRSGLRVQLVPGKEDVGHCPSIDITMQSAAQVAGARTTGVVLTGMGNDGTEGLRAIRLRGGTTIVQDAASCVVNGMPQRAIDVGVVDHVASPNGIAELLLEQANRKATLHEVHT